MSAPQDHSQIWGLSSTHGTQHTVGNQAEIYSTERTQSNIRKGKRHMAQTPEKSGGFRVSLFEMIGRAAVPPDVQGAVCWGSSLERRCPGHS